jgi:hypothetical protein
MTDEEMEKLSASDWLNRFEKRDSDWKNGAVDLEIERNPAQKNSVEKSTEKPENTDDYTVEDWAELMNGTQNGKADIFED